MYKSTGRALHTVLSNLQETPTDGTVTGRGSNFRTPLGRTFCRTRSKPNGSSLRPLCQLLILCRGFYPSLNIKL